MLFILTLYTVLLHACTCTQALKLMEGELRGMGSQLAQLDISKLQVRMSKCIHIHIYTCIYIHVYINI
jgi:hypothetical protein